MSRRIYELSREVIEFRRATHPLKTMLQALQDGFDKYAVDDELRRATWPTTSLQVSDRVDGFSQILRDMLTVELRGHAGLDSPQGFAISMALMVGTCLSLYLAFKRRDWL